MSLQKPALQADVPNPDMIQTLLAGILSKFRVKNPGLFLLIQFGLGVLIYALVNCQELGICINKLFGTVLVAANYLMVILLSSKTASVVLSYNTATYGTLQTTKKPDLLQTIIAGLLDKFKVKNPQLFLLIQFGLGVIAFALTNCAELGICLAPLYAKILGVVDFALMCLIAPRTSFIMDSVALVPKKAALDANIEMIE